MSRLSVDCVSRMRWSAPDSRMTRIAFWGRPLVLNQPRPRHFSTSPRRNIMNMEGFTRDQLTVREEISSICAKFPNKYWQDHDQKEEYPMEFYNAIANEHWLGVMVPRNRGGTGLGISEATMMMQTITESGAGMAGAQAIHTSILAAQPLVKFGREEWGGTIRRIVKGLYKTCIGVTEPNTGLDLTRLRTFATKQADQSFLINGQKTWVTGCEDAWKMILLARTKPIEQTKSSDEGLSLFCIDLQHIVGKRLRTRKINKMGARAVPAHEVFFIDYRAPWDTLIGEEGQGFNYILHGLNAECCLLAGEALGLGYAALKKAAYHARERVVFDRPIGANQGIAHPLAKAYMQLEAAKLATYHAARLYDLKHTDALTEQKEVSVAVNTAKYLASEAAFTACERAVLTLGGTGYATEHDVERLLRESLVPRIAPISQEMILNYISEKVLELPKSY
ncbi:acyl-CoA dehydrogenase/oxidase [Annulohypoxylon stygium]|nr:acyl-CoA dehydrogenase/oxidase [Annulohypoxylon stygium]